MLCQLGVPMTGTGLRMIYLSDRLKSFQEKAPYVAKAEKRKAEYEKNMKAYNKRQVQAFTDKGIA